MLWFWLSLAAAFLWSINNHLDKFLADRYYNGGQALPGTLMFLTSLLGVGIATVIFLINPAAARVPLSSALLMLAAGVCDFVYIFPYTLALMRDEASRVAPLFQLAPVVSFTLAWVFLHERLSVGQITAGLIIIAAAMALNLDIDRGFRLKRAVFGLMALSAGLWALETFLFKFVATGTGYWSAVFYQYAGAALSGAVLAAVSRRYRQSFTSLIRRHRRSVFTLSLFAEIISATARLSLSYASLLAPLAIVTLVANTSPFFVIAIGIILTLVAPQFGAESLSRRHLGQKLLCTAVIFGGVAMLLIQ